MGEVDVIGLVLWCPLTTLELTRPMHWPLRIWPKVTSTMVQSRLSQLLPRACQHYKGLEEPHQMAVSANDNLGGCVIQLRLYLIDIVQKNYRGGFRVIGPFTSHVSHFSWFYSVMTQRKDWQGSIEKAHATRSGIHYAF